jgi:hypothetical protein
MRSNVNRAVGWSQVLDVDQDGVYYRPDAESAETEQFAEALSIVAQIEAIDAETAEEDAEKHGRAPFVAAGPIAFGILKKSPITQTHEPLINRTINPMQPL